MNAASPLLGSLSNGSATAAKRAAAASVPRLSAICRFQVLEGHRIAFVQYLTDSVPAKQFGSLMPATRISEHMIHAGFLVKDRAVEDHFYKDILGFDEMWHGGKTDTSADPAAAPVPQARRTVIRRPDQ